MHFIEGKLDLKNEAAGKEYPLCPGCYSALRKCTAACCRALTTAVLYRAFVLPTQLFAGQTPPGLCRRRSVVCQGGLKPDLSQVFEGGIFVLF
jgi:hypothetical protein